VPTDHTDDQSHQCSAECGFKTEEDSGKKGEEDEYKQAPVQIHRENTLARPQLCLNRELALLQENDHDLYSRYDAQDCPN